MSETVHRRRISGGVVGTENLFTNGLKGVARVGVDIVRLVLEEEALGVGIGGGEEVGFRAIDAVDLRIKFFHPAKHVVKGAILHDKNDNGGDWRGMEEGSDDDEEEEEEEEEEEGNGFGSH